MSGPVPHEVDLGRPPRVVLAGSVSSSERTLSALVRHGLDVAGVLALTQDRAGRVSAYRPLTDVAAAHGIPSATFTSINEPAVETAVRGWAPDLLFVVGLSQLVGPALLAIPRVATVGFHPTRLPAGRGRAPLAWLTLDGVSGAATFFLIDDGVDSGPIVAQAPFPVRDGDYVCDVETAMLRAIDSALDGWLPVLRTGRLVSLPQDHAAATYTGRRAPEDGLIDWHASAAEISALVRATSDPHPGAYTHLAGRRLVVWRASDVSALPWRGVVGRTLAVDPSGGVIVQAGHGLVRLDDWTAESRDERPSIPVGVKLGLNLEQELGALRARMTELESEGARLRAEIAELRRGVVTP